MTSRTWLGLAFVWAGGIFAVVACGNDADAIPTGSDAGLDSSITTTSGGTTTTPTNGADSGDVDAGDDDADNDGGDDGGTPVTDGGDNIDPDAGPADAGEPDGGPCNTLANGAPAIVAVCSSTIPALTGGALVAGTYYLTGVSDLASIPFCKGTFIATGFKETFDLTVDNAGVGTAEIVTELADGPTRHHTSTLSPKGGVNLTYAPTCPPGNSANVEYSSIANKEKTLLRLRLPYGKGEAIYEYTKH